MYSRAFLFEDNYPGVANVLVSCPQALAEEEKRAWYTLFTQVSQEFWNLETSEYYAVISSAHQLLLFVVLHAQRLG